MKKQITFKLIALLTIVISFCAFFNLKSALADNGLRISSLVSSPVSNIHVVDRFHLPKFTCHMTYPCQEVVNNQIVSQISTISILGEVNALNKELALHACFVKYGSAILKDFESTNAYNQKIPAPKMQCQITVIVHQN
ncbi:MAG: hypothetical protein HQK49_09295 [Oligoflexia bacterium]|nr:hypothetical protein [Oligoflexia bacterium]